MNEKEKKVVERIEGAFYSDLGKGINKFQKITLYEDAIRDVRILLNLLEKLQKENEELKNNTRKNENELEFDIDCDWIALQKILDESERSNEYISYKNEKWIKEKYCVPIQKIKDKIEGIQEEGYWLFTTDRDSDKCVEVLQELLEK